MIQQDIVSNITASSVVGKHALTIESNASMLKLLTTDVYNDTALAVMREWSTNAIDACIAAGTPPKLDVHLPTNHNLLFSVRDYGTGLSQEAILTTFLTLGASTKRDSNKFNGTFG